MTEQREGRRRFGPAKPKVEKTRYSLDLTEREREDLAAMAACEDVYSADIIRRALREYRRSKHAECG